jgi:hypothetical protein
MNPPNVKTTVTDPETNITYQILAYRQLTPAEAKTSIVGFLPTPEEEPASQARGNGHHHNRNRSQLT